LQHCTDLRRRSSQRYKGDLGQSFCPPKQAGGSRVCAGAEGIRAEKTAHDGAVDG